MRNSSNAPPPQVFINTRSPISPAIRINPEAATWNLDLRTYRLLRCHHNVNYWRGGSYYGLGPSATGYVRGVRTKNWSNTQLYCEQLEKGRRAIESREEFRAAQARRRNGGVRFAHECRLAVCGISKRHGLRSAPRLGMRTWIPSCNKVGDGPPRIVFNSRHQGLRFADCGGGNVSAVKRRLGACSHLVGVTFRLRQFPTSRARVCRSTCA